MSAQSPSMQRIMPFLKNNTFFGGLPEPALDALIARGHIKKYAKGDVVYRRGDQGDSLMVLLSGRMKVANVTTDAHEVILNFIGVGDVNGEIAALDGRQRSADTVALQACEVFTVYTRDLLPILLQHPSALLEITQILCERLRSVSALVEDSTLEMRGRTARGLLRLADKLGRTSKSGICLELSVSQKELGGYLGLSRENVSRQLGQLKHTNVIRIDGAQITITDQAGLTAIAAASSK
jgi:CRP/FNR family transcriptional regulator, cyclic AMP receptor protein